MIGSSLGIMKRIFGKSPCKIVATYDISVFKKLTRINNPNFPGFRSMNLCIISAMKEDGRLTENENLAEESTIDSLSEYLKDENYIVRREAVIALEKFKEDRRVIDLIMKSLEDKHQDVKRNAAVILSKLKSEEEISSLEKPLADEKWQYVSYGTNRYSFDRVRRRRGLNRLKYYLRNK